MKISMVVISAFVFAMLACKKKPITTGAGENPPPGDTTHFPPPSDPPVSNTIGFFLDDWTEKTFEKPDWEQGVKPVEAGSVFIDVDASSVVTRVPGYIAGHNANSWMGKIVTEPVLMGHLKNLNPGVIRFPGGSISDVYFWNQKASPPANAPDHLLDAEKNILNNPYWYGMRDDSWTISVDDYYSLLQQTKSEGLITVNYGFARYGTADDPVATAAHLAAEWVRYDRGRTKFWEIGNECNGTWEAGYRIDKATNKDGQPEFINGALYGKHATVFIDSMKKAAAELGSKIFIGVYLLEKEPEAWQTATDKSWNSGLLSTIGNRADYYVIHSYYTPYHTNATADEILSTASTNTSGMMTFLKSEFQKAGVGVKPVVLDEWNIFSQGSMQQVSFVNGMHATILVAEAIKNKYGLTARWDLANGWENGNDHGLFNIGDEPGVSKWNPRPPFYYLYYFQKMVGDRMLKASLTGSNHVLAYASSFSSGEKGVVIVNKSKSAQNAVVSIQNARVGQRYYWYVLTGGTDNGDFSRKVYVNSNGPSEPSGGPASTYKEIKAFSALTSGGIRVSLPPRSVVYLIADG